MITTAGRTNAQAAGRSPSPRWANVLFGAVGSALILTVGSRARNLQLPIRGLNRLAERLARVGLAIEHRSDRLAERLGYLRVLRDRRPGPGQSGVLDVLV